VWHAFPPRQDDSTGQQEQLGPSVSTIVAGDEDQKEATSSLQRFLSALAWLYDQPAEVVGYGGDAETDPYHPPSRRDVRTHGGLMIAEPFEMIALRSEPLLRLGLAYYQLGRAVLGGDGVVSVGEVCAHDCGGGGVAAG
jgi:hypothetical protein